MIENIKKYRRMIEFGVFIVTILASGYKIVSRIQLSDQRHDIRIEHLTGAIGGLSAQIREASDDIDANDEDIKDAVKSLTFKIDMVDAGLRGLQLAANHGSEARYGALEYQLMKVRAMQDSLYLHIDAIRQRHKRSESGMYSYFDSALVAFYRNRAWNEMDAMPPEPEDESFLDKLSFWN